MRQKGNTAPMKTTSIYSQKNYQCSECKHKSLQGTNHYGQIYIRCSKCSWKSPMNPIKVHECLEELPEGMSKPENWKLTTLGEIAEIHKG